MTTKQQVVDNVSNISLRASSAEQSKGCGYLLPFLLSCEEKSLGALIEGIESQELRNLIYPLAIIADTNGEEFASDVINKFSTFMELPCGDQLLAIVQTRNALELWSLSPDIISSPSYDLTKFRCNISQYFV